MGSAQAAQAELAGLAGQKACPVDWKMRSRASEFTRVAAETGRAGSA